MRHIPRTALLLIAWVLLSVLSGILLLSVQRQGKQNITRVFEDRSEIAARLTETYSRDLLAQERRVATRQLSAPTVTAEQFARVTNLFGYEAAVLLDGRGRAIRVAPDKPSLVGRDLTTKYAHLRAATAGRTAVSKVVPSATKGIPVVAFATPFRSQRGRRVFSGAFDVRKTPIGAYLQRATALKGARVYLLDTAGLIVASNHSDLVRVKNLAAADPKLARGLAQSVAGATGDGYQYASRRVANTPWRLVISVPRARLYEPIEGSRRLIPWMLWVMAVLAGIACALLVGNLISSRAELRVANRTNDRLARIDDLTGLYNRRQIQQSLDETFATVRRHGLPLSVLMIDIDHFKAINDEHGHDAGDEALRLGATTVRSALRAGDMVGRWGGEEFLAVLPSTDRHGATVVAERLREAVAASAFVIDGVLLPITVSIGAAERGEDESDALVAEADAAMYAAKAAGRDAVRAAV